MEIVLQMLVVAAISARASAPAGPGPRADAAFDEVGVGQALGHETQETAVSRAREDALAKAMLGAADVFYGFSDVSTESGGERRESVAKFLFTSNQGVLTELSAGAPECEVSGRVTTCRLRVKGSISFRGEVDASYQILDQGSGKPLGPDRRQYYDGEPFTLSAAVTKDSFLYVFSWDAHDKLYPIFPSRPRLENRLKAGTRLELPERNSGALYRAALPPGKSSARERLLVVATRREISMAGAETLIELMRRLARLERREWTLCASPYEIVSRSP